LLCGVRGVAVVALFVASAVGVTLATFDGQNTASEIVNRHGFVASRLVTAWQSLADRDRDGFSTILGGGDCNDGNPKVGPAECAMRNVPRRESASGADAGPIAVAPRVLDTGAGADAGAVAGAVAAEKPNIILITVDALRADRLGAYGYARPTSPNLDRFAREQSIVFKWAFAADTKTKPSVPALFAGRHASTLNWTKPRYVPLRPGNRLIAERLRAAGYHTAGIATHTYFANYNHINQGFEHWDTSLVSTEDDVAFGRPTAHAVTDKLLAYIESPKRPARPLFFWAHYFDPHQKYLAHPEFASFGSRTVDRYDQEVAFTDKHLGRLFDALARRADWGRTIVVVTADHGEAFGEHGHRFHGETLYNEQLRVPLIVRVPGESPRVVERPVSLIDVAPTLVVRAGVPLDAHFHGTNLLDPSAASRPVFAELLPENHIQGQKAMIDGEYKLIYHETRNYFVMVNFVADPAEKKNLVKSEPARFLSMRGVLLKWAAGLPRWTEMGEPP
jgi:arylsulfatase A-like enzyme